MKKTTRTARKVLSVFLSVLMILTTLTVAAPGLVLAADGYAVDVYMYIYDGASDSGYGNSYTVVDDRNSEFYGKPDDYKWYDGTWSNSKGYDGSINMAGITLFYNDEEGVKQYRTVDLNDDLVEATTTLGNNFTSMDDLNLDNFESDATYKVQKVYTFENVGFPTEVFWINDEDNFSSGETGFGIYKIVYREMATGKSQTLWTGLSGSETYYNCYYGSITPSGLITPWDDCPSEAQTDKYKFYKDYTTSAVGTWLDPFREEGFNQYPVNNYVSGGVSAAVTLAQPGATTNVDYVYVDNTNVYYFNFLNHSTQTATVRVPYNSGVLSGYTENFTIAPGESKYFAVDKTQFPQNEDGYGFSNLSFEYTLSDVYESDGTTLVKFTQPAGIATLVGDDSKQATTFQLDNFTKFYLTFQTTEGILETVGDIVDDNSDSVSFTNNFYIDTENISTWEQTGFRLHMKEGNYNEIYLQDSAYNKKGTVTLTGEIGNPTSASFKLADFAFSSINEEYKYNGNDVTAYYGNTITPTWAKQSSNSYATLYKYNIDNAWLRFTGNIFKGSTTSSEPGKIVFNNMQFHDASSFSDYNATFSGTINVYAYDKSDLREYFYNIGGLGADWAPMKGRHNATEWKAYEDAYLEAVRVLGDGKTNQKAVTDAYNALVKACNDLKNADNLVSQIAEVTYTKRETDYVSAATDTTKKYLVMPIGAETVVPAYDIYKHTSLGEKEVAKQSNETRNYTLEQTDINPVDYRYWKIDFTGVAEALAAATEILNDRPADFPDSYLEKLDGARLALSAVHLVEADEFYSPTHQSDVAVPLANLNALLAHTEDGYDACVYDGDDEDEEADIVNENFNCVDGGTIEHVCIICGKAQVVENVAPNEGGHTVETWTKVDENNHKGTCTACNAEVTAAHTFVNPVLVRPTLVDGTWVDGTYTSTCVCGETKTEPAVRADYSELEEAVEALNGLKENENLSDEAKAVITDALADAGKLADNLVTAEQGDIDALVKELKDIKADADEAIKNKELGINNITEATSGVKVQFIDKSGLGTIESIQLGKDDAFKIRVANGNADSSITITGIEGEGIKTTGATLAPGESATYDVTAPTEAGIKEYTITYTIDGLKNADGSAVTATTKAYLYVKGEKFTPYHLMDETCNNGPATAKWEYSLEASVGDFAPVYNNKAPKAEFGNDNLVVNKALRPVYHQYDYEDNNCFAECTGTGDTPYVKGDAHAATYRYYIDTSLAPTWQEAGFKAVIAEGVESKYDYAIFNYIRLANNKDYLDSIQGDDKTFSVTVIPGASSNVPTKTWTATSTGDEALTVFDTSDITDFFKETEYLFGNYLDEAQTIYTAYTNFSGSIPQKTESANMMFSYRIGYNMAEDHFLGGVQAESTTMTTHLRITSYDKAALREAVANAETAGYNSAYFDAEKWTAYENALKTAKEVLGKAETNQNEVDAATAALNTAVENLSKAEAEAKFVLTVTHSIHEGDKDSKVIDDTNKDYYLLAEDSFKPELKASIIALDTVNKYDAEATLNITADTKHTYNYWYIDYSGVQGAIDAADAIIKDTTSGYTDEYKAHVEEAKKALEEIKNGESTTTTPTSQSTVNDAIDAVTALTGHTCADTDSDHKCDVCGTELSQCSDVTTDKDHNCDICGDTVGDHEYVNPVLTRPVYNKETGKWTDGVYTSTCNCGSTDTETIARATYTAYDEAKAALEALLEDATITAEAKETITDALNTNKIADDCIATVEEQKVVDDAATALNGVLAEINAGIDDGSMVYVNLDAYKAALETYVNSTEKVAKAEDKTAAETAIDSVAGITETSTKANGNQDKIDAAAKVLADLNTKYANCASGNHIGEVITGTAASCDATGLTDGEKCSVCGVITKKQETIPKAEHNWSVTYTWSDDNSECTATRVCADFATHNETETVKTTNVVTDEATCEKSGTRTYTADFTAEWAEDCTKEVDISATGHDWSVTYTWGADYATCTATRTCANDKNGAHTTYVYASVTSEITTQSTCYEMGVTTYTATFTADWAETQIETEKNVPLEKHTWNKATEKFVADTSVEGKVGYYSYGCAVENCNGELKIYVEAADYSELEKAVETLEKIINDNPNLTDEAKKEIQDAIDKAEALPDDLTKPATEDGVTTPDGQSQINVLVEVLSGVKAEVEADIVDGTSLKADYTDLDKAIEALEAAKATEGLTDAAIERLEKALDAANDVDRNLTQSEEDTAILEAAVKAAQDAAKLTDADFEANYDNYSDIREALEELKKKEDLKSEYVAEIENVLKDNVVEEGLTKDKQDVIDAAYENLKDVYDEISDKISDGSALDADDSKLKEIIEDLKDVINNNPDLTDDAKQEIQNAIDDAQKVVDEDLSQSAEDLKKLEDAEKAAQDALDKANEGINDNSYIKVDYTAYNAAVNAYNNLDDKMSDADKAAVEAIKAEIAEIPADGSAKEYQTQVDDAAAAIIAINSKYADCVNGNHVWGEPNLSKVPTAEEQGEYTEICGICGATQITKVGLADYSKLNEAVTALKNLENTENLTDTAKAAITEALEKAENLDKNLPADATTADGKFIEGGQDKIDALVDVLNKVVTDTNAGITNGSLVKPDFDGYDASHDTYEELVKQYGDKIKDSVAEDVEDLDTIVEGIRGDETATKAGKQDDVNNAKTALDTIIAGITDGSLRDPDYKDVEDKINEAKGNGDLNKDTQDKIKDIEEALQNIKDKKEPEANAKDDQTAVDALEDQLDEILKDIADNTAKAPNYAEWNTAEGTYNGLDKTNVKDEILEEVTNLKNTIDDLKADDTANYAEDQGTVDTSTARLNEIITGINDGSLRDPDYKDVEDKINEAKGNGDLNKDTQDKIKDIEDALKEIKDKKDPEANAKDDQPAVDALEDQLDEILGDIADNTAKAPNYAEWDTAEGTYDEFTAEELANVKAEIITEVTNLKNTINALKADDTANYAEDQGTVDTSTARLNEIIDGIKDGSLKDPDYSKVEEKLEEANNAENLNKDTQDKIDAIEEALQEIKDKTEPEANAKDDQPAVDALEDQLDEILGDIADNTAKAPNYAEWNTAEGTYNGLDKTNVKDEILEEVTNLKNTINTLKADPTANAVEDQKTIDDAADRLNEIITGIKDGTLRDPDYKDVEDKINEAKGNGDLNKDTQDKIKDIEDALEEIKNKEPEANAKDDQDDVDALEDQLDEILGEIADGTAVAPDYSDAEKAIEDAEKAAGDKLTDEYKDKLDELKEKLDEIKNDSGSNKKDDQTAVDAIEDAAKEIADKYKACAKENHTKGDKLEVVPATCTSKGYTKYICTVCGAEFHADYTDKAPHTEAILEAVPPTCSEVGLTEGKICVVCNEILVAQKEIKKLPHTDADDDGVCDVCHSSSIYDGCACLCHNTHWFWQIVYIIIRIIWRVFKIHPVCPCGRIHY